MIGAGPLRLRSREPDFLARRSGRSAMVTGYGVLTDRLGRGTIMKRIPSICIVLWLSISVAAFAQDLGNLSSNPYAPNSTANPYGAGSPYNPKSVNNPFGRFGSPFSPQSARNPYAINAPRLYDDRSGYHGKLSANPFDPDSTSNRYGRFGSPYSPDSINNPYGAGSPFRLDSPNNPYGHGMRMQGGGN
jgi:hypothetical protein